MTGLFGGLAVGIPIGLILAGIAQRIVDRRLPHRDPRERWMVVLENTRRDDGARLLGDIEDHLHLYGIGSDTRPEFYNPN